MTFSLTFVQICRTAPMVQKSSLSDLLIAPMQHQVHYQLILEVSHNSFVSHLIIILLSTESAQVHT